VDSSGQLATLLAEASEDELLELVQEHLTTIDQAAARQAIKNSYASREVLELLASHKTLMSRREFRRAIAEHRQCPEPLALRLVTTLFWRDLVEIGVSMGVRPTVRRAADRALSGRLTVMSVGERMAVARRSSFAIVSELRHDSERRVIEALLDNPRMTEGALVPLLASDNARPDVLVAVIGHRRWGNRQTIRAQFCRNRRAPVGRVLHEMAMLRKVDLQTLAADRRIAPAVRRRAELLLGRG